MPIILFLINEINFQDTQPTLELCEYTTSLCTTIEAVFLHGLKDSFLRQTINVISGEIDRRPEPNFWPALLVFSHKQTIELVIKRNNIENDHNYAVYGFRFNLCLKFKQT